LATSESITPLRRTKERTVMGFLDAIDYTGKRVVVTGAASGIGRATSMYLAELGAEIVALDVSPIDPGPWTAGRVDVGSRASIDTVVDAVGSPVDRLFNIAGVPGGRGAEKRAMMVNFFGLRYLSERLLPAMPHGGAIVNVSSLAGYRYLVNRAGLEPMLALSRMEDAEAWLDAEENQGAYNGYGTSKELVNLWTVTSCKPLAEECGVRINAVAPGSTDTPLLDAFKATAIERNGSDVIVLAARGFMGRFPTPEDQAAACVFLGSDAAGMITGEVVGVDGGKAGSMRGDELAELAPPAIGKDSAGLRG
jgi:NAD(P)-dependent dehydrogenase (short-subunit alcohol dehydrogenase family)